MEKLAVSDSNLQNDTLHKNSENTGIRPSENASNNKISILSDIHKIRLDRLKQTCEMLSWLSKKKYIHDLNYRENLDWEHRVRCDGTPNPRIVQELNTYLFVWREMYKTGENVNDFVTKCLEIFNIMDAVDDIVDLPLNFNKFKLQCFREVRDNLGKLLLETVYSTCYQLLSDYERRMKPLDLETVGYQQLCDAFAVGLFAVCHKPRLLTDNRDPPKCDFPDCLVSVEIPAQLSQTYMSVMALWLRWDPFSDRMSEFDVSQLPDSDNRNLYQFLMDELNEKERLIEEINKEKTRAEHMLWLSKMAEKFKVFANVDHNYYPDDLKTYLEEIEGKPLISVLTESIIDDKEDGKEEESVINEEIDNESERIPHVTNTPLKENQIQKINVQLTSSIKLKKTLSAELERREIENKEKILKALKYTEKAYELNPRRYWIIGGAFNVEMWKLPMQPVQHKDGTIVVVLVGPPVLQPLEYFEKYEPLQLSSMMFSSTSSEDEETDIKKQNQEALQRLVLITIKLPENMLWFENPKPAMWNENKKVWTTDCIHDIRFNDEKQTVSFRTGRMGSFGLAVNRYSNFPFQSWEIRPEGVAADTGVILSITAATVLVEFSVRGDLAAVVQIQNATTAALQEIIAPDAELYVDGNRPPKHAVAERHTYHCMAVLSATHQFIASRWNVHAGPDIMVFQMKEISEGGHYKMVMATPERTVYLKCNEVSQAFSDEMEPGCPLTPDLYSLIEETCSDEIKTKMINLDFKTIETLYFLMKSIKILSYS
ncbi:dynein axonemal intermediate chain 7-like isoform X2 [Daktulosphaira vitifoliae]|uniref:dynein axonemal intermediate chain 7-like isoform X2 n=1 Tax=Daktulosphaira vitifoliae TaxID=58002 RepID=UPI0021A9C56B|nr:dynein axonemal intermediate chain 7-like isoform X2 [Daktulosphaira vitifoliae]